MGSDLIYIDVDGYKSDIYALKDETAYLSSCLDERIDAVADKFDTVGYRIEECEKRIDELFALLRPVLDAMTEKPKQKWLWEIFEPNDIEIDFPYNL